MSEVFLKVPSIEDKEKWYEYLNINMDNPNTWKPNYESWLEQKANDLNGVNLSEGEYPSSVFFLMDNDKIIGNISIRHAISDNFIGGHISFGIKPSERRKGYGTIMLHLALDKCKELDLDEVMLSCSTVNIGSSRVIEKNNGVLKEIRQTDDVDYSYKVYSINIKKPVHRRPKRLVMKKK